MDQPIAKPIKKKKISRSLWYGAVIGFVFSLVFWGYDALMLSKAHVAYAWLPFLIGAVSCSLVFSLAAFLTYLGNNSLLGLLIWFFSARLVAELTLVVPLKISPFMIRILEPGLAPFVNLHSYNEPLEVSLGVVFVWLAVFTGILGLLQLVFVEQAVFASNPFSLGLTFILPVAIIFVAGLSADNMVRKELNPSLVAVDTLMTFAIENEGKIVEPSLARQMHLRAVNQIAGIITPSYRLFLGEFDDNFDQVEVLVDFNGNWASCLAVSKTPLDCFLIQ